MSNERLPPRADPALPAFPELAWRGIFRTYRDLIADVSECPLPFHFAALLSLVAAELGDRACRRRGTDLYPNFFVFCNGRTGTKKSAAMQILGKHFVNRLPTLQHSTFSSVSSAEGLIRILQQCPNTLLNLDEIADFFKTANRHGNRIEPILNQAFDLAPLQTVVKKKTESLSAVDYCLNIHANGTPDHIRLELSEALFSGGVLNRFIVFAAEPSEKEMPEMEDPNPSGAQELSARIAAIIAGWYEIAPSRGSVEVISSPEAQAVHAEWYHRYAKAMKTMPEMEAKPLTRLDVYVKKLATMYCLLETPPTLRPSTTPAQMEAALAVVEFCRASMLWTVREWSGLKSQGQQADALLEKKVEAYLQTNGCCTERVMYRDIHISATESHRIVDSLAHAGVVNVINDRPRMIHYTERCRCFA